MILGRGGVEGGGERVESPQEEIKDLELNCSLQQKESTASE